MTHIVSSMLMRALLTIGIAVSLCCALPQTAAAAKVKVNCNQAVPPAGQYHSITDALAQNADVTPLVLVVKGTCTENVVITRDGTRVAIGWPTSTSWTPPKLEAGLYRWYVWPGFGPKAAARYGRLIGSSSFRVR